MTIPATSDWCPACEETCRDHASVCTVCGTTLTFPPPRLGRHATSSRNNNATNATAGASIRALPTLLEALPEIRQANHDLHELIQRIRQQINQTEADQTRLLTEFQQAREEWQTAPTEWLDPLAGDGSRGRPTSKAFVDALPRTVLQEHSSILFQPLVAFQTSTSTTKEAAWTVEGTLGDFNIPLPSNPFEVRAQVVMASPRTGRGGTLSPACCAQIQTCSTRRQPVLVYFDRGDITFVQKAIMAQAAGAAACLIGNHVADPWPYVMKDSKAEASALDLRIPTILLPKHAATKLKSSLCGQHDTATTAVQVSAHLDISRTSRGDCVVCTESFVEGATVVRLPDCGHVFHEACCLPWLQKHNTCMYCRRELPTDDEEYDRERRRAQRTHAGSAAQQSTEFNNFYS